MIALQGVSKYFGSKRALDNIDFSVGQGEIVGLLGPNGSGKTTTLRLAARYYEPDRGRVLLSSVAGRRAHVGYLPEKAPLYDALSVVQYLEFVGRCKGLGGRQLREGVDRALKAFDLQDVRSTAIGRLSKGFRQRVGLGQAILGDPAVLLLDEATNGLDPMQIIEARRMIREAAEGRAVIFSSHLMQEVQALCSRAVILRHGRLIADVPLDGKSHLEDGTVLLDWRGADLSGLIAGLERLAGAVAVAAEPSGPDGRHRITCRYAEPPESLDEVLRVALAHGHVLSASKPSTTVEDLLVAAVLKADATATGDAAGAMA